MRLRPVSRSWYNAAKGASPVPRLTKSLTINLNSMRHSEHVSQRHHTGWRFRLPALPDHAGRQQAAPADLRQADDLLSALDTDAGGDPRDPADLDAGGHQELRAGARRREPGRPLHPVRRSADTPGPGPGLPDRPRVRRRGQRGADPGRQHLLRPGVPGDAQPRQRPCQRGDRLRLSGQGSRALRRRRVRRHRARSSRSRRSRHGRSRTTR